MNIALRYAARSDVGLVRSNNQDSGYAGPHLLVVADGMGGHAGGDVASSIAIAALAPLDGESHGPDDALAELERSIDHARQDLVERSVTDPELVGMGTTVTAILRAGNKLAMAHLGDSRAYLLRDGELTQVTTDHTFVQHLVDTGRISPDEAETHPQRNVVMRVLGDFDIDLTPDMSVREAKPGDRWLLCSDGLSGFVSPETIAQTLADTPDVDECADHLLQLALRAGSTDNVTVVVADVVDVDGLPDGSAPGTGAQVVGSAAIDRDAPTSAADGPAARAAALMASAKAAATEDPATNDASEPEAGDAAPGETSGEGDDDVRPGRAPRRWVTVVAILLVVAGLGVAAWAGYRWTQTQYYVGVADGQVAVFRGIPENAGPVTLSTPIELTGTRVADLPGYVVDRLETTIPAESLDDARARAERLVADAAADTSTGTTDEPTDTSTEESTGSSEPEAPAVTPAPTDGAGSGA
ncbi:Stp1/IreP family PP2C-type Ser/Thr phosphatase [Cellulosimicrobium protaetiae]|uniref:Serine/threonine protein phosphatase PstP n=1 Tax=Cellulosimicrobium protaetiae TaxID=2587808 RepID=A0A6M5UAD5_9MICO|nr:Stp1/IreP family PP2C-type Ser/Thr phosphatase [Cellulosimicrobium protaetiae]QJW35170.1 Stp1/IreP family PP2C-type Ser/Thr phosphatase [Cellulosimicrobium protaetiae]